jgi:sugar/nucleoside kinase (ribokinase family)
MAAKPLLVVGYLSVDTVVQADGRTDRVAGGAGLYAALGAAAAGAPVELCASVGPDFPDDWLSALAGEGIGLTLVEHRDGPSRFAHIRHGADGRRESTHYADPAWWQASERHAPEIPADLSGFGLVVACPMPAAMLQTLLLRAAESAVPVVADVSEAVAEREGGAILALLPLLDIFAPSREETRLLLPGLGDDDAARALAALGPSVIQKRGADGVFVVEAGARSAWHLPALATRVVDPTGAGDASVGAIGAARLSGGDLGDSASTGLRTGALAVSGHGAGALCPALGPAVPSMEGSGPVPVTGVLAR